MSKEVPTNTDQDSCAKSRLSGELRYQIHQLNNHLFRIGLLTESLAVCLERRGWMVNDVEDRIQRIQSAIATADQSIRRPGNAA